MTNSPNTLLYHVWRRKADGHVSAIMVQRPWPCGFSRPDHYEHLGSFTDWPSARETIMNERKATK